MIDREIKLPPRADYPVNAWKFVQKRVSKRQLGRDEAIFTTSNGYIGIRGSYEEGEPVLQKGTFVSGFYESWPIQYGEEAFGFAKTGQTMLSVTDANIIKLFVDDEPFSLRHAYLLEFERSLDFRNGILERSLVWDTAAGKQIKVQSRRIVSFPERHLAAIEYSVTILNADAHVVISSEMLCEEMKSEKHGYDDDPRTSPKMAHKVFNAEIARSAGQRVVLGHSTTNSKLKLVCGMDHHIETRNHFSTKLQSNHNQGKVTYTVEARKGEPVTIFKFITYHTSSPWPEFDDLADRAERTLDRAKSFGFKQLIKDQRNYMQEFWKRSDIRIASRDGRVKQNLRLHIFHLLQATARVQNSGVGAKGLTGSGYEGHSFWDIEIYMLPFLIYNNPRVAKNLLIYRYNMLDKAREWAKELSHKGALFPWRTISGEEASAFFAAGTAQYHINADIAYAIKKYAEVTQDMDFLCDYGAEILVETARLWADLGFYGKDKKFHIHGVTGPDEYNAIVNNNTFTNLMARENLTYAARVVTKIKSEFPGKYKVLVHRSGLQPSELKEWVKASNAMYVPYDTKTGINPQDDSFLQKEFWDLKTIPKEKFPLLLHYHPLHLYRFQVIKQADVVLSMFLLGDEFSKQLKKKNFDYYDPLTTGDSSLSVSIQGIMAAELGYIELATKYFNYSLLMDIANIGDNVEHGLHLASMGGIWMFIVYGAAGMRDYDGNITFNPQLNKGTNRIQFHLNIRGNLLEVDIRQTETKYTLTEGDGFQFHHKRKRIKLKPGETVSMKK